MIALIFLQLFSNASPFTEKLNKDLSGLYQEETRSLLRGDKYDILVYCKNENTLKKIPEFLLETSCKFYHTQASQTHSKDLANCIDLKNHTPFKLEKRTIHLSPKKEKTIYFKNNRLIHETQITHLGNCE